MFKCCLSLSMVPQSKRFSVTVFSSKTSQLMAKVLAGDRPTKGGFTGDPIPLVRDSILLEIYENISSRARGCSLYVTTLLRG